MNTFHVLAILFIPIAPKIPDIFYQVSMMCMVDVTLLAGQAVYNHDGISEKDYF